MPTLKVGLKTRVLHFVYPEFFHLLPFGFHFLSQDVGLGIFSRIALHFDSRCPDALDRKGVGFGKR